MPQTTVWLNEKSRVKLNKFAWENHLTVSEAMRALVDSIDHIDKFGWSKFIQNREPSSPRKSWMFAPSEMEQSDKDEDKIPEMMRSDKIESPQHQKLTLELDHFDRLPNRRKKRVEDENE